jgi:hypothetical protein
MNFLRIRAIKLAVLALMMQLPAMADHEVSGLQSGVWKAEENVYVVVGDITVPRGLELTLESGVIVKFAGDYGLLVDGDVFVRGTPEKPVVFTSIADDLAGGDTNKDRIQTGPSPLDWAGIRIRNEAAQPALRNLRICNSLEPLISASGHIAIDSLFLQGNSQSRVIIANDTVRIAEQTAFQRAAPLEEAPKTMLLQAAAAKPLRPLPWYRRPLFVGSVALGAAGAVIYYASEGGKPSSSNNNSAIPDPPGPPSGQ